MAEDIDAPVSSLSGGNAQKVLIAKWLLRQPDVLVLDEPTQGVDTGAREGIYDLLRQVAAAGTAIVLVSDDLPELIGLSNRIVVITNGRIYRHRRRPTRRQTGRTRPRRPDDPRRRDRHPNDRRMMP